MLINEDIYSTGTRLTAPMVDTAAAIAVGVIELWRAIERLVVVFVRATVELG